MTASWPETMRERLAHIKVLSLEEIRVLPEAKPFEAGIYFLWRGPELLYIGKSEHVMQRIVKQAWQKKMDRFQQQDRVGIPFDRHTCLAVEGEGPRLKFALQDFERAYIANFDPPCNHTDFRGGT